jgi:glycosyltransferase involved in cell wall biosynthesis
MSTSSIDLTSRAPLRVRTVRRENHHFRLGIGLGQRNATFVARTMTLRRIFPSSQAIALAPEPGYDLLHSVNAIPVVTRRPYVISFENFLPRVPEDTHIAWLERWLQRRLLRDVRSGRCLSLLAMSKFGRRQFRAQNRTFAGRDELEQRMEVLYPAAEPRRQTPKAHTSGIRLLFVGFNFMWKGGPALLRAHERLRADGFPVETQVVSTLAWAQDDFLGPPSASYVAQELRRLESEGVTHHRSLPNSEVLDLMRAADYFVLPTLHDTFGYVAVEALSCGTPVIGTNVCALPEIVEDRRTGFLLPFELDGEIGRWRHLYQTAAPSYQSNFERAIEQLADGIVQAVSLGWERRGSYEEMSAAALERVARRFSREYARARLEEIYELART